MSRLTINDSFILLLNLFNIRIMASLYLSSSTPLSPNQILTPNAIGTEFKYEIVDNSSDYTYVLLNNPTNTVHYLAYNKIIILPYLPATSLGQYTFYVFNSTNLEILDKLKMHFVQNGDRTGFTTKLMRKELGKISVKQSFYIQASLNQGLVDQPGDIVRSIALNYSIHDLVNSCNSDPKIKELICNNSGFMIAWINKWMVSDQEKAKEVYTKLSFSQYGVIGGILSLFNDLDNVKRTDPRNKRLIDKLIDLDLLIRQLSPARLSSVIGVYVYPTPDLDKIIKLLPFATQSTINYLYSNYDFDFNNETNIKLFQLLAKYADRKTLDKFMESAIRSGDQRFFDTILPFISEVERASYVERFIPFDQDEDEEEDDDENQYDVIEILPHDQPPMIPGFHPGPPMIPGYYPMLPGHPPPLPGIPGFHPGPPPLPALPVIPGIPGLPTIPGWNYPQ
jgi:hypothetical protein